MTQPGLIDRRGLLNWADSIGSRSELPRLIRRLILETGKGVVELGFPAGEGVSAASWDGTVRASADTPYVPAGLSLWELSVDKSPGSKADGDYDNGRRHPTLRQQPMPSTLRSRSGRALCTAKVHFADGTQPIMLYRYLDLS